jgi:uncharacterized protein YndB with AHSA1/START domain
MSGMETGVLDPVRKTIRVGWDVDATFRRFTEGMSEWWPLATHSVGGERAVSVVLEGRVGGRVYETQRDGSSSDWGRVTVWEPPRRLSFTWHPGREADGAQLVEVTFTAEEGGTRLALVHSGWERLGARGASIREGYEEGWEMVLTRFAG